MEETMSNNDLNKKCFSHCLASMIDKNATKVILTTLAMPALIASSFALIVTAPFAIFNILLSLSLLVFNSDPIGIDYATQATMYSLIALLSFFGVVGFGTRIFNSSKDLTPRIAGRIKMFLVCGVFVAIGLAWKSIPLFTNEGTIQYNLQFLQFIFLVLASLIGLILIFGTPSKDVE